MPMLAWSRLIHCTAPGNVTLTHRRVLERVLSAQLGWTTLRAGVLREESPGYWPYVGRSGTNPPGGTLWGGACLAYQWITRLDHRSKDIIPPVRDGCRLLGSCSRSSLTQMLGTSDTAFVTPRRALRIVFKPNLAAHLGLVGTNSRSSPPGFPSSSSPNFSLHHHEPLFSFLEAVWRSARGDPRQQRSCQRWPLHRRISAPQHHVRFRGCRR